VSSQDWAIRIQLEGLKGRRIAIAGLSSGELSMVHLAVSPHLLPPPHLGQSFCIDKMPEMQSTGRSRRRLSALTRQACDACKIRKVKCINDDSPAPSALSHPPCQRCSRLTIQCTYALPQRCRGPRKSRRSIRHVLRYPFDMKLILIEIVAAAMTLVIRPPVGHRQRRMPHVSQDPDLVMQRHKSWNRPYLKL